MKIELKEIKIKELIKDYTDNSLQEEGITGFDGKLDIRPKYQREFVYNLTQQESVIDTVLKNFPLNVMYWVKKQDTEDEYELLDGQQRTISICKYVKGAFSIKINGNPMCFHNLTNSEQDDILNYKLMIYFCDGTDREKLDWFKTINIAGEKLTEQELRNAVYTGKWLTDAKKYFSKTRGAAYSIGSQYIKGVPIRQDYLETAIKWISEDDIEKYMSQNQNKANANELWTYFQNVIMWTELMFISYRKEMKGVDWGTLYNKYKNLCNEWDGTEIEKVVANLMQDDEISKKSGIYPYIITREEKYLNIRAFTDKQKREAFEKQERICPSCEEKFKFEEMEGDHITPWCEGGKTSVDNLQMLCKTCNRTKSNK